MTGPRVDRTYTAEELARAPAGGPSARAHEVPVVVATRRYPCHCDSAYWSIRYPGTLPPAANLGGPGLVMSNR